MDLTEKSATTAPRKAFFVRIVDTYLSSLTKCHKIIVPSKIEKYYKRIDNLHNNPSKLQASDLMLSPTKVCQFRFLLCKWPQLMINLRKKLFLLWI